MSIIIPSHPQSWPIRTLPYRLEEYVLDNGGPPTTNRSYAKRITPEHVVDLLAAVGGSPVNPRYFVGTALHEANFAINEWDTEIATRAQPDGFESVGMYQIGNEESHHYKMSIVDMLDPEKATFCMKKLAEDHRDAIRWKAQLAAAPDPDWTEVDANGKVLHVWPGGAMSYYLAIAHNHGLGTVLRSIGEYGLDVTGWIHRNASWDKIVKNGYGRDCATGSVQYPAGAP